MRALEALEATAFAEWVNTAMLGFPLVIALHSVGMAAIVGVSLIASVHAIRPIDGLSGSQLLPAMSLARAGLILNAVTGIMLFVSRGSEYILNPAFLLKLVLVLLGSILSLVLFQTCARSASPVADNNGGAAAFPRPLAIANILVWFGAVATGRLIAYVQNIG